MIVAFSGVKFSGKDTTAEGLIRSHGFRRMGLADKLKDICSSIFGINREDMDNPILKDSVFEKELEIQESHITDLVEILKEDGFDVDIETFLVLCKNFIGKKITSIRDLLQVVGTDMCRSYVQDDIWLSYIKNYILNVGDDLVITDARFPNERKFLRDLGAILVLVVRPGYENQSTHISENQLGNADEYDVIVTNDKTIMAVQSDIAMWYTVVKDAIKSNKYSRR